MKPPAHHLQAVAQWQKEVEYHLPGLKVSNLPCLFVVPVTLDAGRKTTTIVDACWGDIVSQPDKWDSIPEVLQQQVSDTQKDWNPPEGWSYASTAKHAAPGEAPHHLDLPNPRHYTLEGWQVLRPVSDGYAAMTLRSHFKEMLGVRWQPEPKVLPSNPLNKRKERIRELLDYHHSKGGNPEEFRGFVRAIARNPGDMPPPPTMNAVLNELQGGKRSPIRDAAGLAEQLLEWVGDAENMEKLAALFDGNFQRKLNEAAKGKGQGVHVRALQAAIDLDAQNMSEEDADRYAVRLWDNARASNSRGLSVCPFPRLFRIGSMPPFEITAAFMHAHQEKITSAVSELINKKLKEGRSGANPSPTTTDAEPWQYAAIAPSGHPHTWDIPNPRIYHLSGKQVPMHFEMHGLALTWEHMLRKVWRDSGADERTKEVHAFLSYHMERGGKPDAFKEYLEALVDRWNTALQANEGQLPANGSYPSKTLVKRMEQWLAEASKAPPKWNIPQSLAKQWDAGAETFDVWYHANEQGLEALQQCPKCKAMGKLCPAHMWEQYKAHLHEQGIEWAEHVGDPAFLKMKEERQAWYMEDLLHEKDLCEKNAMDVALRYGFPVDEALKHNGKLQWIVRELADVRKVPASVKDATSAKPVPLAKPLTLAERLNAKHGAREAFDTMLLIDGYTTEAGEWKLASRKGRAEVVAAWDAVVEIFGVEGYAKEEKSDKTLSAALREYIPGLTIGERPNKLRNTSKGSAYAKARVSCERYLKERRERIIAERSDTSE